MNSSDSPGYLTPTSILSPDDIDPDVLLRSWIAGGAGLAEEQIISRWPTGPSGPLAADMTFCEFGIMALQAETAPIFIHQTEEQCQFWRTEVLECLLSFSGPYGLQRVLQFRDGLCVSQNNDTLNAQGLSVVDSGRILFLPERIESQWRRRYDITVHLSRKITREYAVKSLVEAPVRYFGE